MVLSPLPSSVSTCVVHGRGRRRHAGVALQHSGRRQQRGSEGECVPFGVHAPRVSGSRITASQGCSAEGKKQARFAAAAFELRRLVVDSRTSNAIPRAAAAPAPRSTSLGAAGRSFAAAPSGTPPPVHAPSAARACCSLPRRWALPPAPAGTGAAVWNGRRQPAGSETITCTRESEKREEGYATDPVGGMLEVCCRERLMRSEY